MKNGKQPQRIEGLFPLFYDQKNTLKIFPSFFAHPDFRVFFVVWRCWSMFVGVGAVMLNKASFCADRVYGFVCLLIFQVRGFPDLFFYRN